MLATNIKFFNLLLLIRFKQQVLTHTPFLCIVYAQLTPLERSGIMFLKVASSLVVITLITLTAMNAVADDNQNNQTVIEWAKKIEHLYEVNIPKECKDLGRKQELEDRISVGRDRQTCIDKYTTLIKDMEDMFIYAQQHTKSPCFATFRMLIYLEGGISPIIFESMFKDYRTTTAEAEKCLKKK